MKPDIARCVHHHKHDWLRTETTETCRRCGRTRLVAPRGGYLTPREAQIATYLQDNPGVHRPREFVRLFGFEPAGRRSDSNLIRAHICSLRRKLADPGRIQTIRGRGYRWRPPV